MAAASFFLSEKPTNRRPEATIPGPLPPSPSLPSLDPLPVEPPNAATLPPNTASCCSSTSMATAHLSMPPPSPLLLRLHATAGMPAASPLPTPVPSPTVIFYAPPSRSAALLSPLLPISLQSSPPYFRLALAPYSSSPSFPLSPSTARQLLLCHQPTPMPATSSTMAVVATVVRSPPSAMDVAAKPSAMESSKAGQPSFLLYFSPTSPFGLLPLPSSAGDTAMAATPIAVHLQDPKLPSHPIAWNPAHLLPLRRFLAACNHCFTLLPTPSLPSLSTMPKHSRPSPSKPPMAATCMLPLPISFLPSHHHHLHLTTITTTSHPHLATGYPSSPHHH